MILATTKTTLTASDALILLVTVESLLFAALAVSVTLAGREEMGGDPLVRGPRLAWSITAVIGAVSLGAFTSWLELFAGSGWPCGFRGAITALAILVGVAAQPVLAVLIAKGVG